MLLGRRRRSGLCAIVVSTAIEPQYVCGAATCGLRSQTEIKSGHVARGQPRRDEYSGKKEKNPLLGVVCLLTTGGLPRNGSAGVAVRPEAPQIFGPIHRRIPLPGESSSGPSGCGTVVRSLPYSGVRRPCHVSAACRAGGRVYVPWP